MWYWVKSPGGVETDYNLSELKTAVREGKVRLDWMARRYTEHRSTAVNELLIVESDDPDEAAGRPRPQGQDQPERNERVPTASFECLECGTSLRLRLLAGHKIYRCPSCKTEYKTVQTDGERPVFLISSSRHYTQHSEASATRKRKVPPEVHTALAVFALEAQATLEDVRLAYRDQVKQYHPDRVAHLGPELRNVAEKKTKEINSAYQVLERFYSA
jgi:hypothetical protein